MNSGPGNRAAALVDGQVNGGMRGRNDRNGSKRYEQELPRMVVVNAS